MNPIKHFIGTMFTSTNNSDELNKMSIYDVKLIALNGQSLQLSDHKGKYILIVNVASKCGFTPQYKDLQKLQDTFDDKLTVVGVPCNQFGAQEPGNSDDISAFCELNYGVTFPITEKIKVKGSQQHDLYKWLTNKKLNGVKNSNVKWNFQKYLIDPNGQLIDYYFSMTGPMSSKITKHLK